MDSIFHFISTAHLRTLHMVASLILLYGTLAVGTWLGVGNQPQVVGRVFGTAAGSLQFFGFHLFYLRLPLVPLGTSTRRVRFSYKQIHSNNDLELSVS